MLGQVARDDVAAALARVYARPEFAERQLPGTLQWIADTWAGIRAWFVSTLTSFLRLEDTAPALMWFVVIGLAFVLLLSLAYLIQAFGAALRGRELAAALADTPAAEAAAEREPRRWETRAREAAAAGRLREAALALYYAVVLRLDERGAVRFRAGKTPGDYRGEARRSGAVGGRFDAFVRSFQPLAFGPRAPDTASWESLRSLASELGAHA